MKSIRLALTGDVMLGRLVDQVVRRVGDPVYVWGDTAKFFGEASIRLVNLECVIASEGTGKKWFPKMFHFKALPWAIDALKAVGIDAVSLANNHVLDYQEAAFAEMIKLLDEAGIAHAGAGESLTTAKAPAVVSKEGVRVSLLAITDNEPGWEAEDPERQDLPGKPGIFYVPLETGGERFERLKEVIVEAKKQTDIVVVSAHVGPHMREAPGPEYLEFARSIIEAGADVYMGSSNHSFQGVEIYKDRPILYDLGDFVDDYAVDPVMRNDWSFLFFLEFESSKLISVSMVATAISDMQVNLAPAEDREKIIMRMQRLCKDLGTETRRSKDRLEISLD